MVKQIIAVAFVGSLLCVGCYTPLATRELRGAILMDAWLGSDVSAYMNANGYYTTSRPMPNGDIVYVFNRSSTYQTPIRVDPTTTEITPRIGGGVNVTTTSGRVYGGQTVTNVCIIYISTDSKGIILAWRKEGDACF